MTKLNKIYQKTINTPLVFIASNSGTGKSTFFKWMLIRRALKGKGNIDFFFRYENEMESKFTNDAFLTPPSTASNRLKKLAERLTIKTINSEFYLIEKKTERPIGQALAINTQKKYKSTENALQTVVALFDECVPDDGGFCQNETYKFCRLIDTRARWRNYKVICLYNNISPLNPYRGYFKDNNNVKFIDFVGKKYNQKNLNKKTIQSVLAQSLYGAIYNKNEFEFFPEFYIEKKCEGKEVVFYVKIADKIFGVILEDGCLFFIEKKKIKKNRIAIALSLNNSALQQCPENLSTIILNAFNRRVIFTNKTKNTFYLKILGDFVGICYND